MSTTVHDPVRPLDRPPTANFSSERRSERSTDPPASARRAASEAGDACPADHVRAAPAARRGDVVRTGISWGIRAHPHGEGRFLDEDAQTYTVMGDDGELIRYR
jgi:hypothetical protein